MPRRWKVEDYPLQCTCGEVIEEPAYAKGHTLKKPRGSHVLSPVPKQPVLSASPVSNPVFEDSPDPPPQKIVVPLRVKNPVPTMLNIDVSNMLMKDALVPDMSWDDLINQALETIWSLAGVKLGIVLAEEEEVFFRNNDDPDPGVEEHIDDDKQRVATPVGARS